MTDKIDYVKNKKLSEATGGESNTLVSGASHFSSHTRMGRRKDVGELLLHPGCCASVRVNRIAR